MAKFAKIGLNNVVERLVYMSNLDTMNDDGVLDETIGKEKLEAETGHATWLLCTELNGDPSRKNIPTVGWTYSSSYNGFYSPRPIDRSGVACTSWTLNSSTCKWDAPITKPLDFWTVDYVSAGIASTACNSAGPGGGHQDTWHWNEVAYDADTDSPKTIGWVLQN